MQTTFEKYISDNMLFRKQDKILATVSGGADSVVMLHLIFKAGYYCGIAHCNFKLRGKDSDNDEIFTQQLAEKLKIPFFVKEFDTKKFARKNKYSIEEAARILRYKWFEKIRAENNFTYIATAHHSDDNTETFFINLTAGTGIRGIRGIKNKTGKIVRPLLFAHKQDIEKYCINNNIDYKTDKTNFENKFIRNKFRNKILPMFKEINPAFDKIMKKNIKIFGEIEKIYNKSVDNSYNKCVITKNNQTLININKLKSEVAQETFLFEFLKKYGFNSGQNNDIFNSLDKETGKQFFSKKYRLLKDRKYLIIIENKISQFTEKQINKNDKKIINPLPLQIETFAENNFAISKNQNIACIDADKITFPLTVRNWKKGDYFYPLGMKGRKLLSDFFTDNKLNIYEKENIYILCSENKIVWIIGKRLDDRFKISKNTKNILKLTILKN